VVDYVEPNFAPDIDTAWSVNPGTLTSIDLFAPLQNRGYGSMAVTSGAWDADFATMTGANHLVAYMFRQVNGTVRFLTFRQGDIDEYDSAGTRTNRATGLTTASNWTAAAWGNQIIAVSKANATQSSTGAGFSALGGSSPKAALVASNVNFVMMADVDDGGSNVYADMVWWSAIRNPSSWAASLATQAGNVRLLDAPGPITALVSYRNQFVAFKDNAIFVGQYVGPPYVFSWAMVSSRVGCVGAHAVTELDGKLYFLGSSGFWEYDGQNIRNVGLPVFQSFMTQAGYYAGFGGDYLRQATGTSFGLSSIHAVAEDAEGVVWFMATSHNSTTQDSYCYGYNARTGKWGRAQIQTASSSATIPACFVRCTTADLVSFSGSTSIRVLKLTPGTTTTAMASFTYPDALTTSTSITTGKWFDQQTPARDTRLYLRHRATGYNLDAAADVTGQLYSYTYESQTLQDASKTLNFNPEFQSLDGALSGRYKAAQIAHQGGNAILLSGIGLDTKRDGGR
jgi:hypothetical protein